MDTESYESFLAYWKTTRKWELAINKFPSDVLIKVINTYEFHETFDIYEDDEPYILAIYKVLVKRGDFLNYLKGPRRLITVSQLKVLYPNGCPQDIRDHLTAHHQEYQNYLRIEECKRNVDPNKLYMAVWKYGKSDDYEYFHVDIVNNIQQAITKHKERNEEIFNGKGYMTLNPRVYPISAGMSVPIK